MDKNDVNHHFLVSNLIQINLSKAIRKPKFDY